MYTQLRFGMKKMARVDNEKRKQYNLRSASEIKDNSNVQHQSEEPVRGKLHNTAAPSSAGY